MKKTNKKMFTSKNTTLDSNVLPPPRKKLKKIKRKTIIAPPVSEIIIETPIIKKEENNKIRPEIVSFYGNSIRNTFMNNQWYFSLEDILRVAKVVDPTKFLIDLKNREGIKDEYYNLIETFSYYEGGSPIIIPIVNFQNFMHILPTIRNMDHFMPGPFPDWLKNMANRKF